MHIGFVTCQESLLKNFFPTAAEPDFISPEPAYTPDDFIAVEDLRHHGHTVSPILWGTPPAALMEFDLIVIRSPWDYMDSTANKTNFFAWLSALEEAHLPVQNSPALMRWLYDKHYLQDFADRGVNIIPTRYVDAGSSLNLATTFAEEGAFVLKPCISAAGAGLFYIDSASTAEEQQLAFQQQLALADYMLQPFIPEITSNGEWSLIFFGGQYSHAILKKPAADSIMVHAERGGTLHFPVSPSPSLIDFAVHAHQQIPAEYKFILYLRVDVIESANGPLLVECEGVEPELFFRAHHGSEMNFRLAVETAKRIHSMPA